MWDNRRHGCCMYVTVQGSLCSGASLVSLAHVLLAVKRLPRVKINRQVRLILSMEFLFIVKTHGNGILNSLYGSLRILREYKLHIFYVKTGLRTSLHAPTLHYFSFCGYNGKTHGVHYKHSLLCSAAFTANII